jgi:23S rRNA-intervening sequence protein
MPESVEKLEIWQEAVEIVRTVYELTKSWPREEMYGLTSQIQAGSSIHTRQHSRRRGEGWAGRDGSLCADRSGFSLRAGHTSLPGS